MANGNEITEENKADWDNSSVRSLDQSIKIPVIEEQMLVEKKWIETGKVRVFKTVSEEEHSVNLLLNHKEVNVERISINKHVDTPPPAVRYEGDKIIFSILREEAVVVKRLLLVEELHVTKHNVETSEDKKLTLRKEEVKVERESYKIKEQLGNA